MLRWPSSEAPRRRGPAIPQSRSSLVVLFSVVAIDLIGFGIVVPILPFWADAFGASATQLGLLMASYAVAQFVFAPLWGRLSDRVGRRRTLLFTIAGTAVSLALLGLANSLAQLFAARLLAGAFAANISVASAYVTDATDEQERTVWMGRIGAAFGIGFVLGPAIGGLLSPFGYAVPLLVAAGLAALNWLYALGALEEPAVHRARDAQGIGRAGALRLPRVAPLCAVNFSFSFAVTQLEAMFALYMLHRFDYDAMDVAWILVGMAVVMGGIQGGGMRALSARADERTLMIAGTSLLAVAFLAMPWTGSVALLLVPLIASAIGRGIAQPALMSLVSFASTPESRGAVMGTFQSAASLARVVGPFVAGLAYDLWQPAPFLIAAAAAVLVVGMAGALPRGRSASGSAPSPSVAPAS